jgi:hypothetical protein
VAKTFLIFVPNDSSTAFVALVTPKNSAEIKNNPANLRAAMGTVSVSFRAKSRNL